MARYRKIYPCFWRDDKVLKLPDTAKLVALYCLCGPQTNRIGLYVLSPGLGAEDCAMEQKRFLSLLDTVCHTLSWRYLAASRILYIPSWWAWNRPDNEKAMIGALTDLGEVTQTPLTQAFIANRKHLPDGMGRVLDTVCHTVSIQEQEQEQEQEQDKTDFPPCGGDHIPDSGKKPPGKPKAPAEPKPPAPYRELTDYFCSRWAEINTGQPYPFNGRDGKDCATIWEYVEHNLDKAKKIIDTFLICREPFFAGHKLAKLAADLPKFIAAAYPPAPSPKPRMTVAEAMARTKRIREQQELENGIDNRRRNPD